MNRVVLSLALVVLAGASQAQTPPVAAQAAPGNPVQAQAPDPGRMYVVAIAVVRAIDAGQAAQLWDSASAVTRSSVKRETFVESVARVRTPLGAASGREWISVSRQTGGGQGGLPAGNYISVELATSFAGNRTARELVSFRLDDDGTWRFTGYVLR